MPYNSLQDVSKYYELAEAAHLTWKTVDHPELETFSQAVNSLVQLFKQQDEETGWQFLTPARKARNVLTTVPLPFSHASMGLKTLSQAMEGAINALRIYGGDDAAEIGLRILMSVQRLSLVNDAPLLNAVIETIDGDRTGILLPMGEYANSVRNFLKGLGLGPRCHVLNVHDLRASPPLDELVLIGPLFWYRNHEFVLASPRAVRNVILKWSWHNERSLSLTVLEGSVGTAGLSVEGPPTPNPLNLHEEVEPQAAWDLISRSLLSSPEDHLELVPARSTLLADHFAVFLPENEDRTIWVLDPNAPLEDRTVRIYLDDLQPGQVILLRTSGGGDLIVPIANEILGPRASALRNMQRRWKAGLAEFVRAAGGLDRAAAKLQGAGCSVANRQNIQNWLSERSLRTDDFSNWQSIMDAILLGSEATKLWQAMGLIESAHRKAGKSIGRQLREMANRNPLDRLIESGRQVFYLPSGGSVTAFRIESFSPKSSLCSPTRLFVPIRLEIPWHT
jgi:hypothetical protein